MLSRAFHSLRKKWKKNVLIALLFTALFAVSVGAMALYTTSRAQLDFLKQAVGNSVTLVSRGYLSWDLDLSGVRDFTGAEVARYVDSPLVESWNYAGSAYVYYPELKPLYEELRKDYDEHTGGGRESTVTYHPLDSRLDPAFTVNGYRLLEGGHLAAGDWNLCLISRELAELNGLGLGDTVVLENKVHPEYGRIGFIIKGIFQGPETNYLKGRGHRPEESLFLSYENGLYGMQGPTGEYQEDTDPVKSVTVYLKDGADLDAFLEETKQKFAIRDVLETHFQKAKVEPFPDEVAGMSRDEAWEYVCEHPRFDLQIDREWYNMVGEPLEKVTAMAGVMTAALLGAIALVLALVSVLVLKGRKKEAGILLSMGESRGKVAGQLILELLAPLLLALALGLGLGVTAGMPLVDAVCNGVYEQSASLEQGKNDVTNYAHRNRTEDAFEIYVASSSYDLQDRSGGKVMVFPRTEPEMDAGASALYLTAALLLTLLTAALQTASVLRLNPARILTGKK